jgi:nitroimidazol reductase NimA-like FMN-containing flavoprotein (pyridoxamine 5'-phosphate oxidase superfamily)
MLGELNEVQIENVLTANIIGRLACYADERIYIVPVTYLYVDGFLLGHTITGMKTRMLRKNPKCCFEVDSMQDMTNWQSVIAWGTFEELEGNEAKSAMEKLINRFMPLMTSQSSQPTHGLDQAHQPMPPHLKVIVYKIRIDKKTGRFEKR